MDVVKQKLMKKYTQSNICLEKLYYIRTRQSKKIFSEAYGIVRDDLKTLQIEINILEEVRDTYDEREELLYESYNVMNEALWHLVVVDMRSKEYQDSLKIYMYLKDQIRNLERKLYFGNRNEEDIYRLEDAKRKSVSEVIPGYDKIKII